ncbi:MAG: hypothetical protein KME59_13635 [Trichormus sp. ATA11-4-KO1]|jgi:hypothetical protein|nr:hypothetical protein [Trichormus sp. ATA11-4-KO1]
MALSGTITLTVFTATMGIVLGALLGVRSQFSAYLMAGISLVAIALGFYVGWQATNGNKKYFFVCSLAISIVSQGGTSFRGANLYTLVCFKSLITNIQYTGKVLKELIKN